MSTTSVEIADFYQQLSLLTRSSLPLPETLRQLAANTRQAGFRRVLQEVSEEVASGKSLADAMARHPRIFTLFHVKMVASGLKSNTLPGILAEIARVARIQYRLSSMLRNILAYPLLTITIALFIFLMLNRVVIPSYSRVFAEMLPGQTLPPLTLLVLGLSALVCQFFPLFIGLFLVHICFSIWLFSDTVAAHRCLLRLAARFPFANVIFYNLSMAKICSLWGMMMKQGIPETDSFPEIARLVEHKTLACALERVAEECAAGKNLYGELRREPAISKILVLTLENSAENTRSEELTHLAELFYERAAFGFRWVGIAWESAAVTVMSLSVAVVLLLLFLPIINAARY